jgi:hypothetical protein
VNNMLINILLVCQVTSKHRLSLIPRDDAILRYYLFLNHRMIQHRVLQSKQTRGIGINAFVEDRRSCNGRSVLSESESSKVSGGLGCIA